MREHVRRGEQEPQPFTGAKRRPFTWEEGRGSLRKAEAATGGLPDSGTTAGRGPMSRAAAAVGSESGVKKEAGGDFGELYTMFTECLQAVNSVRNVYHDAGNGNRNDILRP